MDIYFSQSGYWEVQDQDAGRSDVWREPAFWLADSCLLTVSAPVVENREKGKLSHFSSYRSTNSIMSAPPS